MSTKKVHGPLILLPVDIAMLAEGAPRFKVKELALVAAALGGHLVNGMEFGFAIEVPAAAFVTAHTVAVLTEKPSVLLSTLARR